MGIDLFGPASAPGAVSIRPGDARSFGATDTFFRDCSSADLDDGTEFQAAWFNQMLASARALTRGNGLTAGAVPVVAEDNADDALLLKAVQHLIQRNQMNFAVAAGTASTIVVTLSPAPAEYKQGMRFDVQMPFAPVGGGTTINFNILGAKALVTSNGSPLTGLEWAAGDIVRVAYDGVKFQATPTASLGAGAGVAQRLTASLAAAAASVNFTADYVTVASALAGAKFTIANLNATLNVGTTGANGMDAGAAPVNSFVSIYAIYNPTTQTSALLATTASQATIYAGASMPAGYTASALISIWPTNGSAQLVAGSQIDRAFYYFSGVNVLVNGTAVTPTVLSLASCVPSKARQVYGFFRAFESGTVTVNSGANFTSISGGAFQIVVSCLVAGGASYYTGWLPLPVAQTVYYQSGQASLQSTMVVEGYMI